MKEFFETIIQSNAFIIILISCSISVITLGITHWCRRIELHKYQKEAEKAFEEFIYEENLREYGYNASYNYTDEYDKDYEYPETDEILEIECIEESDSEE